MCVATSLGGLEIITGPSKRTKMSGSAHGGPTGRGVVRQPYCLTEAPFYELRNLCRSDIAGPTCGKDDSQDRLRGRLYGRGHFGGGNECRRKYKGGNYPHIRWHEPHPCRTQRTQTTKSGGREAFKFGLPGYGPKHRLPHNCSEGSAHVSKAERLVMQSHQDMHWAPPTDRQCTPV